MPTLPPLVAPFPGFPAGNVFYWEDAADRTAYTEEWSPDRAVIERVLYCESKNRYQFRNNILPSAVLQGTTLHRQLPLADPDQNWLYCTWMKLIRAAGVPAQSHPPGVAGVGGGKIRWDKRIPDGTNPVDDGTGYTYFRVRFEALPYAVLSDAAVSGDETLRYVERKPTYAAENLPVPGNSCAWAASPVENPLVRIPESIPKLFPHIQKVLVWHYVPCPSVGALPAGLDANVNAAVGTVNQYAFDGNAAGLLLFLQPQIKWYTGFNGTVANGVANSQVYADVSYVFAWRPKPHNWFFRPTRFKAGLDPFQLVTHDGTVDGNPVYPVSDHSKLFKFA